MQASSHVEPMTNAAVAEMRAWVLGACGLGLWSWGQATADFCSASASRKPLSKFASILYHGCSTQLTEARSAPFRVGASERACVLGCRSAPRA